MLERPAAITNRPNIDEAGFQFVLRRGRATDRKAKAQNGRRQ
jgi:hypothetical protein